MPTYDPLDYPPAGITTDLVVLTIRDDRLTVLLVRRGEDPYLGKLALPGGFVRPDESLDAAARRELHEETGLTLAATEQRDGRRQHAHLEQLKSYGDPGRDPRLHVVTVAYLALAPRLPVPAAGRDAAFASWLPVSAAGPGLAFDHDLILADGLERARSKLEYTPLATAFCPSEFTVGQLRRVYEIVWDTELDARNFHRKVTGTPGFLVPTGQSTVGERGRPAQFYRRGRAVSLYPPMLRDRLD
jgi:8-oxo-dGTP diphosphatase